MNIPANDFIKQKLLFAILATILLSFAGCRNTSKNDQKQEPVKAIAEGSFGYDLEFLSNHRESLILRRGEAMILIAPEYQGRVMTSTAGGATGKSYGWINYELIRSGLNAPHFNNYGGEERFWLGPEGGQYSIFFPPGADFVFDNWQVPAPIDSEAFELVSSNDTTAVFMHEMKLKNYSGFDFVLRVDRTVTILDNALVRDETGLNIPDDLALVAYKSVNKITNTGKLAWTRETGLLSVWVLGQFISSPANTVIVPYIQGPVSELGTEVTDDYFGKVPSERLKVKDGIIYFKADGNKRSKIGLSPSRAMNYLGSYDHDEKLLTLVYYNKPSGQQDYVNSLWKIQDNPYSGDAINSYNDGPLDDGSQLGPFYELETSSPAADLLPGASLEHISTTIHVSGKEDLLNQLIESVYGITINDIIPALSE